LFEEGRGRAISIDRGRKWEGNYGHGAVIIKKRKDAAEQNFIGGEEKRAIGETTRGAKKPGRTAVLGAAPQQLEAH